ncbi:GNAT family N-acetyltransferase [Bacillaceae bacterium SIJ1]|uniref:GNAT family N-acetyltransferase n=1 Tax=Litoribacterium kuwaitense TaxID=1398745 RepID=UPI0013ED421A|nr:GNAT family protein [Litoribacterium kuwaitense]NGP46829.1 GNAT family N-acetyltransferase [Litoribacterium kuwaitense]
MSNKRNFPQLETKRLRLRELNFEDSLFIFKLFSDKEVCKYLYDEEIYTDMEDAQGFIEWYSNPEENLRNRWGIERKVDRALLGTCGFDSWDRYNHIAEIGYDLWHEYWGHGYMTETLECAIEGGFNHMNLNRIQAFVALENEKSAKLLEKLGFMNEGIFREKHLFRGLYYDHYCYSLLKREWV